jgi:hypothetical protein
VLWWTIGAILVILLLSYLSNAWRSRGSDPYLRKAQFRVSVANDLWADLQRRPASGRLDYQELASTERELQKIWLVQRGESSKLPDSSEYYAAMIEYLYRKTSDIRTTGGQNLPRINAEFDSIFDRGHAGQPSPDKHVSTSTENGEWNNPASTNTSPQRSRRKSLPWYRTCRSQMCTDNRVSKEEDL